MLRRKVENDLLKWKRANNKTALLVTGARQVGKTASIRQFGKTYYDNFIEINFITDINADNIFSGSLRADDIILNLSAFVKKALVPGKTLIFLDEIQECPNARTAIKFLVEDGRFDYIESGSLLGINYKEIPSLPVGYEEILQMYPMDFEEFLWANNVQEDTIDYLKDCFINEKCISEVVHEEIKKLFQRYMIIGGMPAVVSKFAETKDIGQVITVQKRIMELYRQDITKYSETEKMRIRQIFDHIPAELNKNNKRFTLSDMDKNARYNRYESGFMWLSDAGVSLPCYNISQPVLPFELNTKYNLFKLFLCDTGLLCSQSLGNIQFAVLNGDTSVNMGSILENTIAQLLVSNNFKLYYYNSKKVGEIDFIIQKGAIALPVECKSGKDYNLHKALDNLLSVKEYDMKEAIVLYSGNIKRENKILYLPWYMVSFITQPSIDSYIVN